MHNESEVFLSILVHILSCDFTSALVLNTTCARCTGQAVMPGSINKCYFKHFGSNFRQLYVMCYSAFYRTYKTFCSYRNIVICWIVVAHAFNPSTWEAGAGRSL